MAGNKERFDMTYLTSRTAYRSGIVDADSLPDAVVPFIRLDQDHNQLVQHAPAPPTYGPSGRAYNGHLELYVEVEGSSSEIPDWGVQDTPEVGEGVADLYANIATFIWSEAAAPAAGGTGHWVLVDHRAVTCNTLISLRNIPSGVYKVLVSAMTAGSTVNISEQHTE